MGTRKSNENWDDLRYFLAVARTGTLSAAAERLGTEHTTVARHIESLESNLNHRLFHKSNLGYALSPSGERLLATAESIESAMLLSKASAGNTGQDIVGTVRIGAPEGFGSIFLAPRIHELTDRYPGLEIEIFAASRIFSLSKREAEIAIGLSCANHMRVASRRLTDYSMFAYASKSYLEASKPIYEKDDLEKHPFVGYAEGLLFAPELNVIGAIGVNIEPRIRCTNVLTRLHATLAGHTLAILPAYIAAPFPNLVRVLSDQVSFTRSFHMHVHQDHRKTAHVRAVMNFIAAQVEQDRALFTN